MKKENVQMPDYVTKENNKEKTIVLPEVAFAEADTDGPCTESVDSVLITTGVDFEFDDEDPEVPFVLLEAALLLINCCCF